MNHTLKLPFFSTICHECSKLQNVYLSGDLPYPGVLVSPRSKDHERICSCRPDSTWLLCERTCKGTPVHLGSRTASNTASVQLYKSLAWTSNETPSIDLSRGHVLRQGYCAYRCSGLLCCSNPAGRTCTALFSCREQRARDQTCTGRPREHTKRQIKASQKRLGHYH